MATYTDRCRKTPLTGKDVGVIFGKVHEGVALTGDVTAGTNKDFVFTPATYGPFYPRESNAKDFVSTKSDITVYDDGVEVTVANWAPTTGTATLSDAPAKSSVMTGDCVEQMELYIAQNAKLTPKRDTTDLDQLRNSTTRKSYGSTEFTLTADFYIADIEQMKFIFEPSGTDGRYNFPTEPPKVYAAIIIMDGASMDSIIYCGEARAKFSDIINAKAGKDPVENGVELTFSSRPYLVDISEVS